MICTLCKKHASFEHTVFRGTNAVKVGLCPECSQKVGADNHLEAIRTAAHGDAKHAAVEAFLKAVGK
jgi:protein-arginine kinase activator protein McsA